jgi:hypothetical protein
MAQAARPVKPMTSIFSLLYLIVAIAVLIYPIGDSPHHRAGHARRRLFNPGCIG